MSVETYEGSCHCGQVTFEVRTDLELPVTTCNCTICRRSGTMLSFVPAAHFVLKTGEDVLTDYQFGRKRLHHPFCSRCGIKAFARGVGQDGRAIVAVNVRCLDGVDLDKLAINRFNGRDL